MVLLRKHPVALWGQVIIPFLGWNIFFHLSMLSVRLCYLYKDKGIETNTTNDVLKPDFSLILIFKHILPKRYDGLTLWPLIILKESKLKSDTVLINHERIHLRQQLELLIIFFYIWYFIEWLIGVIRYGSSHKAYRNISFEKEAYDRESDMNYLAKRPFANFLKYMH